MRDNEAGNHNRVTRWRAHLEHRGRDPCLDCAAKVAQRTSQCRSPESATWSGKADTAGKIPRCGRKQLKGILQVLNGSAPASFEEDKDLVCATWYDLVCGHVGAVVFQVG